MNPVEILSNISAATNITALKIMPSSLLPQARNTTQLGKLSKTSILAISFVLIVLIYMVYKLEQLSHQTETDLQVNDCNTSLLSGTETENRDQTANPGIPAIDYNLTPNCGTEQHTAQEQHDGSRVKLSKDATSSTDSDSTKEYRTSSSDTDSDDLTTDPVTANIFEKYGAKTGPSAATEAILSLAMRR